MGDGSIDFKDEGKTVKLSIKVPEGKQGCKVHSKTTTLAVHASDGSAILNVPELCGTVDAAKTLWKEENGMLTITLHKLGTETWNQLEAKVPISP